MPPHCDSMDGPVVLAARRALTAGDPTLVLPYVKADAEPELLAAYDRMRAAHDGNPAANELAERYFYETVVRLHRAGEGAPYTGLRPAGEGFGPVIPLVERAIESGSPDEFVAALADTVRAAALERFERVIALQAHAGEGVPAAREYVEEMLGLEVWAHHLHGVATALAGGHDETTGHSH